MKFNILTLIFSIKKKLIEKPMKSGVREMVSQKKKYTEWGVGREGTTTQKS
jgi:hypothetical protein